MNFQPWGTSPGSWSNTFTGCRRLVEVVLDLVVARDLLGRRHVERAIVELDAVGQLELLGDDLGGALALVAGDRIDLAGHEQRAHEHRALVAAAQAARIEDAALVDLDLEAGRGRELRQLRLRRRHRRGGDRGHLGRHVALGPALGPERLLLLLLLCEGNRPRHQAGGERRMRLGVRASWAVDASVSSSLVVGVLAPPSASFFVDGRQHLQPRKDSTRSKVLGVPSLSPASEAWQ